MDPNSIISPLLNAAIYLPEKLNRILEVPPNTREIDSRKNR